MFKLFFLLIAISSSIASGFISIATAKDNMSIANLRQLGSLTSTKVGVNEAQGHMIAIGEIDDFMFEWLERSIKKYPQIKTLYIDSFGGEGDAAIKMANLIATHSLKLIVDGRCFSACAQFLFLAAKEKEISAWSMLAVHQSKLSYHGKTIDNDTLLFADGKSLPEAKQDIIKNFLRSSNEFWASHNFKTDYIDLLRSLQKNRRKQLIQHYDDRWKTRLIKAWAKITGQAAPSRPSFDDDPCLKLDIWLVSPKQLKEMGFSNFKQAWFPANQDEVRLFLEKYELDKATIFWGDKHQLEAFCR